MSCVLYIYGANAYKEYLLPAVDNADYDLVLNHGLFQLQYDLVIPMEIIDGFWRVKRTGDFRFIENRGQKSAFGETLKDKDIYFLILAGGERITMTVEISNQYFRVYPKFSLEQVNRVSIGSGLDNDFCYDFRNIISAHHAEIVRYGDGFALNDLSRNGAFINGKRIIGKKMLSYGDVINIYGLKIIFLRDHIAISLLELTGLTKSRKLVPFLARSKNDNPRRKSEPVLFHRSPRYIPEPESGKIEIEAPPAPKEVRKQSLLLTIGPSFTMALPMALGSGLAIFSSRASGSSSGAFMYTGLVTAVCSAVLGMVWAILRLRNAKKVAIEEERRRNYAYGEYLSERAVWVRRIYEKNVETLKRSYPPPTVCCSYSRETPVLWNRNRNHEDFLVQRLGIGDRPFQAEISIPKEKFTMINDDLAEKPRMIQETYAVMHNVPIGVDLQQDRLVGIVGGPYQAGCYPVLYSLAAQIAANNCYTEVKMAFLFDKTRTADGKGWGFARWFPHVWSEDKKIRFVADDRESAADVCYELSKVLKRRKEERSSHDRRFDTFPRYVVFVENSKILEGEPAAKYLLDDEDLGVTTIFLAERTKDLPNSCQRIIENTEKFQGMYLVTDPYEERTRIRFDRLEPEILEQFARRLSSIRVGETETGGEIPASLTFFDMYGIRRLSDLNVVERWKKNRTYENIRGMLGQKAGGVPCYLDVHEKYHGPHGLVAGTTGSGKSETLQTYILSLAINYSPYDVGFFVIDYKGGGMANLFSGLPHLIGQISNLSGSQVRRAMVSIKSENLKRQRIFNENGVNNINSYTRLYKNKEAKIPVPHLFIIIDEFAELKREEPEFMKELISVAQVGRSLGVHLILATQKPSGTVDDNIWSNSKFRLCLRVQDRQDSMDMLHRPDAAYITQAGRCYLQVGNDEIFELFQSGWSGAPYTGDDDSTGLDIAHMLAVTGKAALIGNYQKERRKEQQKIQWVDRLLAVLDAVASREEIQRCQTDIGEIRQIAVDFFGEASRQSVDYSFSEYNLQRVQELICAYGAVLTDGVTDEGEILAARILKEAAGKGRKLPETKERTQLDAVVEYLAKLSAENGYVNDIRLWLPELPEQLYLEELDGYANQSFQGKGWSKQGREWTLEAYVGLCDDPANQTQMPLLIDLARNGNHALCGSVATGKSTFLLTLLFSLASHYTPRMLNIYALDFSSKMLSSLEGLPHVGGVLYESDDDKIGKLFTMLDGILKERKSLLRGGSYSQYAQAAISKDPEGPDIPAIVFAIDNYSAFRSKTKGNYDDVVLRFAKECVGYGIFLVITAGGFSATEIPSRLGDNIRTVICLEMNDKFTYSSLLRLPPAAIEIMPEENTKGRGLVRQGDSALQFQVALTLPAEDDFERQRRIGSWCERVRACWGQKSARKIPEIPENPVWSEFAELEETEAMVRADERLPIGYNQKNASVYGIDLDQTYCYLISGKKKTGKTNLMRCMMAAAVQMKAQVIVVDFGGELKLTAEALAVRYVTSDWELYDYLVELQPQFVERNRFRHKREEEGATEEEIKDEMKSYGRIFILIGNLPDFVAHLHKPEQGIPAMEGFAANLLDKGADHRVYWIACMNQDEIGSVLGKRIYDLFIRDRNGIHFGGNVAAQKILNFEYLKYNDRMTTQKAGIAMLPQRGEERVEKVIVPLYRRG